MHRFWLAGVVSLACACGSTAPSVSDRRNEAPADEPEGEPVVDASTAKRDAGNTTPGKPDAAKPAVVDSGFEQCADTRVEAERMPGGTNVVWVIDTSGSMNQEAALVQENLNRFVSVIEAAGLTDYRVVMISEPNFVNVPDPLRSDATHFLYIDERVGSDEPLSDLLQRYPDYKDFLLPDVITHFVTVTDDESQITGEQFVTQMEANLGKTFRSHAIASPPGDTSGTGGLGGVLPGLNLGGCRGNYGAAARAGAEHWKAAALTMGLTFSICSEDWSGLFDTLADAVSKSAAVPCSLELPATPAGQVLDLDRINVVYTPDQGSADPLGRVPSEGDCGSKFGWHYDSADKPTGIVLCPASCKLATGGGALQVALGCNTIVM
jgi:hypothetical protein